MNLKTIYLFGIIVAVGAIFGFTNHVSNVQAQSTDPTLTIHLPPKTIYQPDTLQFKYGAQTDTFSNLTILAAGSGTQTIGKLTLSITTEKRYPDFKDNTNFDSYLITVSGFQKGNKIALNDIGSSIATIINNYIPKAEAQTPPPASTLFWNFMPVSYKLTFKTPVPQTAATDISRAIHNSATNTSPDIWLAPLSDCANGNTNGIYLCMNSTIALTNIPGLNAQVNPVTIKESVQALSSGVNVFGNVAAPTTIKGFTLQSGSIAVGGTIRGNNNGGTPLENYFADNPNSKIKWANVSTQLSTAVDNAAKLGSNFTAFPAGTFNLNSSTTPNSGVTSSSSTPPEGKIWTYTGDLSFTTPMNFVGRGTIIVNGNVTINGTAGINDSSITCSTLGDFGLIARGSITINNGVGSIQCGAYVAIGTSSTVGSIISKQTVDATKVNDYWNLIFVAKDNVTLPNITNGAVAIQNDGKFAANPTAGFSEILDIIFVSPS